MYYKIYDQYNTAIAINNSPIINLSIYELTINVNQFTFIVFISFLNLDRSDFAFSSLSKWILDSLNSVTEWSPINHCIWFITHLA